MNTTWRGICHSLGCSQIMPDDVRQGHWSSLVPASRAGGMAMLGKGCERKCEALGQAELSRSVFPSSWTTFRNTLKELCKQQTEGQEPCCLRKRDVCPQVMVFLLPNAAHLCEISPALLVCFCCWVIEETTKPAERTLIWGGWFVCLVWESAMKIWGKLSKTKQSFFLGS